MNVIHFYAFGETPTRLISAAKAKQVGSYQFWAQFSMFSGFVPHSL